MDQADVTARQMRRMLETGGDRVAVLCLPLGVLSHDDERALVELIGDTVRSRSAEDSTR